MTPQDFLNDSLQGSQKQDLITIDLGNSNPHYAVFKHGQLEKVSPLEESIETFLPSLSLPYALCSVRKETNSTFAADILPINGETGFFFRELKSSYAPTLGHDRLIASYFLSHFLSSPFTLVDAGTFLTIDQGSLRTFEGGFIFPGIRTLKETYQRGELLPFLETPRPFLGVPSNTEEAMEGSLYHYHQSLVEKIRELSHERLLILSGGEASSFQESFPDAQVIPHLLHYALYFQYVRKDSALS